MKKQFIYLSLFCCVLSTFVCSAASRQEIKKLADPLLDSLKVVIDKDLFARGELVFRSETPFKQRLAGTSSAYTVSTGFSTCIPINGKMYGLVSPPLKDFAGGRIALIYYIVDGSRNYYELLPEFTYRLTIEGETAKQEIVLKLAGDNPVSVLRFSHFEIEIWEDNGSVRQAENDPPVLRRTLSLNQEEKENYKVNYFYKDPQGVIKLVDFEDGADYSEPQFKGGAMGQYFWMRENLQYPEEARKNGMGGTVLVNVTIDEEGNVENATLFSGRHELLNKEALRLVYNSSGMWIPAQKKGVPMKDQIMWAIQFDSASGSLPIGQSQQIVIPEEEFIENQQAEKENQQAGGLMDEFSGTAWSPGQYLTILLCLILFIFLIERIWNKLQEKKYLNPNNIPFSIYNKEALRLNDTLVNDTLVVVKGITKEEFSKYIQVGDDFTLVKDIEPGTLVFRSQAKMNIDALCYFVSVLNAFSVEGQIVKCVAWRTVPIADSQGVKVVPAMFYAITEKNEIEVFVTTKENNFYRVNAKKLIYEPVVWKEPYREPPYDYRLLSV
ncbi:MAG: energy transducer TonB [Tannerellaceae bacterium]|nr:energy transducer TonB [Tannerellaceae bacterium]